MTDTIISIPVTAVRNQSSELSQSRPCLSQLITNTLGVEQSTRFLSSNKPSLTVTSQPRPISPLPLYESNSDVEIAAEESKSGCLSFCCDNLIMNIPRTFSALWNSSRDKCIQKLQDSTTRALDEIVNNFETQRAELESKVMNLLGCDERTAIKYTAIVMKTARFERETTLLKDTMELLSEELVCLKRNNPEETAILLSEKSIQLNKMEGRLNEIKIELALTEINYHEQKGLLETLKKEESLLNTANATDIIRFFMQEIFDIKSTVTLGNVSYGIEHGWFSPAYTRTALQFRLVLSPEDVTRMLLSREIPRTLSPELYLNNDVGIRSRLPVLRKIAHIDESKINVSVSAGGMIRDRIGLGCVLNLNQENKEYQFDKKKGWMFFHEQLARVRVNASLSGGKVRAGVQFSNYASISISKSIYSLNDENLKILSNLGITLTSATVAGGMAYWLLPPDITQTAGLAVAGQVAGGYIAAHIPGVIPNKSVTQSMEFNNMGATLGVPAHTGVGAGIVFRAAGKIPVVTKLRNTPYTPNQDSNIAGEKPVRQRKMLNKS